MHVSHLYPNKNVPFCFCFRLFVFKNLCLSVLIFMFLQFLLKHATAFFYVQFSHFSPNKNVPFCSCFRLLVFKHLCFSVMVFLWFYSFYNKNKGSILNVYKLVCLYPVASTHYSHLSIIDLFRRVRKIMYSQLKHTSPQSRYTSVRLEPRASLCCTGVTSGIHYWRHWDIVRRRLMTLTIRRISRCSY